MDRDVSEKVRYLKALSQNMSLEGHDTPADVWREVPGEDLHLPIDQMVYVGDGSSDLPAFNLMQDLAEANYFEGAELLESLCLSVESIAKLVRLRKLGKGEKTDSVR